MNSQFSIYIVKTDRANPRHHGLHTNTSSHVITLTPSPGDQIEFVCRGEKNEIFTAVENGSLQTGGSASVIFYSETAQSPHKHVGIKITSHPGRATMLGEDGLEDAFGNSIAPLLCELLNRADWKYAPVEVEVAPLDQASEFQFQYQRDICGNGPEWYLVSNLAIVN